jgi:hypothetical protein
MKQNIIEIEITNWPMAGGVTKPQGDKRKGGTHRSISQGYFERFELLFSNILFPF